MAYPEQLIIDVVANLNSQIKEFYIKNASFLGCKLSFSQYVSSVLEKRFQLYTRDDKLRPLAAKAVKSKNDKRRYMYSTYDKSCLSQPIESKDNPFHFLSTLPSDTYIDHFGEKSFDQIIEEHRKNCDEWLEDTSNLLISFPGIAHMKKSVVSNALELDVMLGAWDYILKELDGDIGSLNISYPSELIDKPVMASKAFREKLQFVPDNTDYVETIIEDDSGQFIISLTKKADELEESDKTLNADAKAILSALINSVDDLAQFAQDHKVALPMRKLASAMVPYSINSSHYDRAERILEYMYEYDIKYINPDDPNNKLWMRILNMVEFMGEGEKRWVEIEFSKPLVDDVLQHRLVSVTKKSYEMLEDPLSKVLCHFLKKEQLQNSTSQDRQGLYKYSDFLKNVRFPTSNKRKNIAEIEKSLEEFQQKNIIIENFFLSNDTFFIIFLPLSETELRELSVKKLTVLND